MDMAHFLSINISLFSETSFLNEDVDAILLPFNKHFVIRPNRVNRSGR